MMRILEQLDFIIEKITSTLLVLFVVMILFFSCGSIVLRWTHSSQLWIDPLVRHLVFFCSFLGGILATGKGTHIGIDLIGKMLESKKLYTWVGVIKIVVSFVSVFTLIWLAISAIEFAEIELRYGKDVFWGIKSGILVSVIPVGFSLLAYRSLYIGIKAIENLVKRG